MVESAFSWMAKPCKSNEKYGQNDKRENVRNRC